MSKSPDAFRTISEVAEWLDIQAHVLRFWESKFTQVKPVKRAGGRRYYRPSDMLLLGGIKHLLHDKDMAIKDVQAMIREHGVQRVQGMSAPLEGEEPVTENQDSVWDDRPRTSPDTVAAAQEDATSSSSEDTATAETQSALSSEDVPQSRQPASHEDHIVELTEAPHLKMSESPIPSPKAQSAPEASTPDVSGILFDAQPDPPLSTKAADQTPTVSDAKTNSPETTGSAETAPPTQVNDAPPPTQATQPAAPNVQSAAVAASQDTAQAHQPTDHPNTVDVTDQQTDAHPIPTVSEAPISQAPSTVEHIAPENLHLSDTPSTQAADFTSTSNENAQNHPISESDATPLAEASPPVAETEATPEHSVSEEHQNVDDPSVTEPVVAQHAPSDQEVMPSDTANPSATAQVTETQPDFFSDTPVENPAPVADVSSGDEDAPVDETPPLPSTPSIDTLTESASLSPETSEVPTVDTSIGAQDTASSTQTEPSEEAVVSPTHTPVAPNSETPMTADADLEHPTEYNTTAPIDENSDQVPTPPLAVSEESEMPLSQVEASAEINQSEDTSPQSIETTDNHDATSSEAPLSEHTPANVDTPADAVEAAVDDDLTSDNTIDRAPQESELLSAAAEASDPAAPSDLDNLDAEAPLPETPATVANDEALSEDALLSSEASDISDVSVSTPESQIVDDSTPAQSQHNLSTHSPDVAQSAVSETEIAADPDTLSADTLENSPPAEQAPTDTLAVSTPSPVPDNADEEPTPVVETLSDPVGKVEDTPVHSRIPLMLTRLAYMPSPTSEEQTAIEDVVARLYARQ